MVDFMGIGHPRGEPSSYNGLRHTEDELVLAASGLVGKPILYEHDDTSDAIGCVNDARVNDQGQLEIRGRIERDTILGCDVINKMRSGRLDGLSLGTLYAGSAALPDGPYFFDKDIKEVSVTADPALPDTRIKEVGPDSESFRLKRQILDASLEKKRLENHLHILESVPEKQLRRLGNRMSTPADPKEATELAATTADAAAAPTTTEDLTGGKIDTSKLAAENKARREAEEENNKGLKRKLDTITQDKADLAAKVREYDEMGIDPVKAKEYFARKAEKKRQKLTEEIDGLKDYLSEAETAMGVTPNATFGDVLERMKTAPPEVARSLIEVMGVANAYHNKSVRGLQEQIKTFQQEKESQTADVARLELERDDARKQAHWKGLVDPMAARAAQKPKSGSAGSAAASGAAAAASSDNTLYDWLSSQHRVIQDASGSINTFVVSKPSFSDIPVGMSVKHAPKPGGVWSSSADEQFAQLLQDAARSTPHDSMDRMNIPAFSGFDFGPVKSDLDDTTNRPIVSETVQPAGSRRAIQNEAMVV